MSSIVAHHAGVRCAGGKLRNCCTMDVRGPVVRLGMVTEAFVSTSCEKKAGLKRGEGLADASKHEKELHRSVCKTYPSDA